MPYKTRQLVALLLICMTVGGALACQVRILSLHQAHAMPDKHQHHADTSAPTGHSLICCMTAVLPTSLMLALRLVSVPHATSLVFNTTAPVVLPFIPPRYFSV